MAVSRGLKAAITANLVDYIAMDIKAPPENIAVAGVSGYGQDKREYFIDNEVISLRISTTVVKRCLMSLILKVGELIKVKFILSSGFILQRE